MHAAISKGRGEVQEGERGGKAKKNGVIWEKKAATKKNLGETQHNEEEREIMPPGERCRRFGLPNGKEERKADKRKRERRQ